MAYFVKLNDSNIVEQIIVVHNNELLVDGVEMESKGISFCQTLFGGNWKQTSDTIRKNYAGIGYIYDATRDAFIAPKPFNSWVLDEATCRWQAPTPYPTDDERYIWSEDDLEWQEVE
jgi:hypothetical protein